jgi:hypothetical protein
VPETDHTGKRRVIRPLLRNGIAVVAAALVGVAFAAPAHAEDPSTPAPLTLGVSAVIPPDDPQALPADDMPPVDPSADVVPPEAQEIPAKSTRAERPNVPRRVISAPHVAHAIAGGDRHPVAVAGWYQVSQRQYRRPSGGTRSMRTTSHAHTVSNAVDVAHSGDAGESQTTRVMRDAASHKCVELCAVDRRYNVPWNASDITTCISALPPQLRREVVCQLLLERLRVLIGSAESSRSSEQYQQVGTQYQSTEFDGAPRRAATANTAGWQRVVANTAETSAEPVLHTSPAGPRVVPQARAPVVSDVRATVAVRKSAGPAEAAPRGARSGAATVARAPTRSTSSDWFLRTLLLLGVGAIALLLVTVAKVGGVDKGVTELGARVGSRGLTPSRIALRNTPTDPTGPRGRAIRYRE